MVFVIVRELPDGQEPSEIDITLVPHFLIRQAKFKLSLRNYGLEFHLLYYGAKQSRLNSNTKYRRVASLEAGLSDGTPP